VETLNLFDRLNFAVFPGLQGGPHENTIAAVAVALREAMSEEFVEYQRQVRRNAVVLATALQARGHRVVTDGTENHLLLWDLRPLGLTGNKLEKLLDKCNITVNKNTIYGDKSALAPGGVRLGTPALTSRGFKEADFERVAEFLDRAAKVAIAIQEQRGKLLKDFLEGLKNNSELQAIRADVEKWSSTFPMPG